MKPNAELPPLDIKCTSVDCENDLHCFLQSKKMLQQSDGRKCRACGADLVDWSRLYRRDTLDAAYTFRALQYELIRHHFWHVEIDQRAMNQARRKGKLGLREVVEKRVRQSVGAEHPYRDGTQTPKSGRIEYYGQHATAACCRRCIEAWHGIPTGRALTEDEIRYLSDLIMLYIEQRLPDLTPDGEAVPRIKTN